MRTLVMGGGPWSAEERAQILEYAKPTWRRSHGCSRVMLREIDIPRAFFRGRYMVAAARIERNGVPLRWQRSTAFDSTGNVSRTSSYAASMQIMASSMAAYSKPIGLRIGWLGTRLHGPVLRAAGSI